MRSPEKRSAPRLLLIGTVHREPAGEEMLRALLAARDPDQITLEMSPYALAFRQDHGASLLLRLETILDRLAAAGAAPRRDLGKHPAVTGIRTLLELPFEYRAALAFAEATGRPLTLIDLPEVSAHKLRQVEEELISYDNIKVLVRQPEHLPEVEESYAMARTLLFGAPVAGVARDFLQRRRGDEGIGRRDAVMAAAIRTGLRQRPGVRLAHIGGWVHLVDDPRGETLYSLLRDFQPERILLNNYAR
jgi:hypothetical protein